MWRNWQTRRFQVPVGNSVWVQIPSSAPRKGDNFDTKSIEIIAFFLAFRGRVDRREPIFGCAYFFMPPNS